MQILLKVMKYLLLIGAQVKTVYDSSSFIVRLIDFPRGS